MGGGGGGGGAYWGAGSGGAEGGGPSPGRVEVSSGFRLFDFLVRWMLFLQ